MSDNELHAALSKQGVVLPNKTLASFLQNISWNTAGAREKPVSGLFSPVSTISQI